MQKLQRVSLYVDEGAIREGVERAAKALAPDVVRIRFNLGEDWTGDDSIFFKIVVSDKAGRQVMNSDLNWRVKAALRREIEPEELGLIDYFNFRSVSELAQMNEKDWD